MEFNQQILANTLSNLRDKADVTQAQVSEKTGISDKMLSKYETGITVPDIDVLVRLADYYGVSIDYLVTGIEKDSQSFMEETAKMTFNEAVKWMPETNLHALNAVIHKASDDDMVRDVEPDTVQARLFDEFCTRSSIVCTNIFSTVISSDETNIALTRIPAKDNCSWMKDVSKTGKVAGLFEILSDEKALRLLRVLHTAGFPIYYTAKFAAEKCGITEEEAANILNSLAVYEFIRKETAHLGSGDKVVFIFDGSAELFTLAELAYDMVFGKKNYLNAMHGPYHPVMKEE